MKRILAWVLVLSLLLCGCGGKTGAQTEDQPAQQEQAEQTTAAAAETTAQATTEPTTEPTTVPTEPPVLRNPVNGTVVDEPFTGRIFANTVSNLQENLPHVGVIHADVVMEMYVSMNNTIRCLALFSDIEKVNAIGATRSTRPIFNDIAQHYDLILSHAGGSSTALKDASSRGIDNFNIDSWVVAESGASYRDKEYKRTWENCLFGIGSGIKAYAESQGVEMELEKDYGFRFTEDGMPADGEDANRIAVNMIYGRAQKETVMEYQKDMGKYVWYQYGKPMQDQITQEYEAFTNVLIMFANVTNQGSYHYADFVAGGTGYYANGGKLVPMKWSCEDEDSAFRFYTTEGEDLEIGVGNTYICIVTPESPVTWEAAEVTQLMAVAAETEPAVVEETAAQAEAVAAVAETQAVVETQPAAAEETVAAFVADEDCLG